MAMSAYYLKGVQPKNVELLQIFAGIMPFLAIVIFLCGFLSFIAVFRNQIAKLVYKIRKVKDYE